MAVWAWWGGGHTTAMSQHSMCDVDALRCDVICSFPHLDAHCSRCVRRPMRFGKRADVGAATRVWWGAWRGGGAPASARQMQRTDHLGRERSVARPFLVLSKIIWRSSVRGHISSPHKKFNPRSSPQKRRLEAPRRCPRSAVFREHGRGAAIRDTSSHSTEQSSGKPCSIRGSCHSNKPNTRFQVSGKASKGSQDSDKRIKHSHYSDNPSISSHNSDKHNKRLHDIRSPKRLTHDSDKSIRRFYNTRCSEKRSHDSKANKRSHYSGKYIKHSHDSDSPSKRSHDSDSPGKRSHDSDSHNKLSYDSDSHNQRSHDIYSYNKRYHDSYSYNKHSHDSDSPSKRSHDSDSYNKRSHDSDSPSKLSHDSDNKRSHDSDSPSKRFHDSDSYNKRSHDSDSHYKRSHGGYDTTVDKRQHDHTQARTRRSVVQEVMEELMEMLNLQVLPVDPRHYGCSALE